MIQLEADDPEDQNTMNTHDWVCVATYVYKCCICNLPVSQRISTNKKYSSLLFPDDHVFTCAERLMQEILE